MERVKNEYKTSFINYQFIITVLFRYNSNTKKKNVLAFLNCNVQLIYR